VNSRGGTARRTLGVDWQDFARLSSAARAKRGETNGADPPRTTFARPRHQHRRDAAHTTHPNHGPKCEKLPGRVRETATNRRQGGVTVQPARPHFKNERARPHRLPDASGSTPGRSPAASSRP